MRSQVTLTVAASVAALALQEQVIAKSVMVNSTSDIQNYKFALQNECGYLSVHGLWPNPASFCSSEKFDENQVSNLSWMQKYWKSCEGGNSVSSILLLALMPLYTVEFAGHARVERSRARKGAE